MKSTPLGLFGFVVMSLASITQPQVARAQLSTSLGSGAGSGLTSAPTSPSPTPPAITSAANSLGTAGASTPGLAQENNWTLSGFTNATPGSSGGSTAAATQAAASAGSTDLNSINASTIATSGNPNTASSTGATSIGTSTGASSSSETSSSGSIAGTGRPEDYRIPIPPIGVDLGSIRVALGKPPSATPQANGD